MFGRIGSGRKAIAVCLSICVVWCTAASAGSLQYQNLRELETVHRVYDLVKEHFVDEPVQDKELIYGAIEGLLASLDDQFTRFLDPETYKEMQTESDGEFGGLGIMISVRDGHLVVISPIDSTPAAKAGIEAGDIIMKVNGDEVRDITLPESIKILRGPKGSKVNLTVKREGVDGLLEFEIERALIKIESVKNGRIGDDVQYIRLTQFIETTATDLENVLKKVDKEKPKGVILDLRNNPGGLLDAAVEVSRLFVPKGNIVTIKGRGDREVVYSSYYQAHHNFPLVVLVNKGSASASEIVAGAIKDSRRGLTLGTKTFGKGCVQTVMEIGGGSAIALTTAWYYTPSGACIHNEGIEPEIPVKQPRLSPQKKKEILKKEKNGFMQIDEKTGDMMVKVPVFDVQLQRAVDILRSYHIFRSREEKALTKG